MDHRQAITLDRSSLERRVSRAVEELGILSSNLSALGNQLGNEADLQRSAPPEALRQTAVAIRAGALSAIVASSSLIGVGETLSTLATILESVDIE